MVRATSSGAWATPIGYDPAAAHELRLAPDLTGYDALETNDSAVKVLGDETLRTIARELVAPMRSSVTIDWTMRENVRARLRGS